MIHLPNAVDIVLNRQKSSGKPLAIILAGHNGSGKTTLWYAKGLADKFQVPLINADRMMMSILPETSLGKKDLPKWASRLRDSDPSWMHVAQKGVEAFVAKAMAEKVPFAMETVFSHWRTRDDGTTESKIDLITQMQQLGYFVVLFFVGLANVQLSISRVNTRVRTGGHDVDMRKLLNRFPRTQRAIGLAVNTADAAILTDNSRTPEVAFTVCRIQMGKETIYDCRDISEESPTAILDWLNLISPR